MILVFAWLYNRKYNLFCFNNWKVKIKNFHEINIDYHVMTLYRYLMGVSILYMQLAMALFFLNLKEINKAEQFTQNVY